jgi:hypothetical protein
MTSSFLMREAGGVAFSSRGSIARAAALIRRTRGSAVRGHPVYGSGHKRVRLPVCTCEQRLVGRSATVPHRHPCWRSPGEREPGAVPMRLCRHRTVSPTAFRARDERNGGEFNCRGQQS